MSAQTWSVSISPEECEELLAAATLGRLGVVTDGRPEIFPVSHVFDRNSRCVMFPTNIGTKLHAALDWPWVAFEVDGLADDQARGWSVLVVGRAERMSDKAEISRVAADRTVLWRSDADELWVRIVPTKVTGVRIGAVST